MYLPPAKVTISSLAILGSILGLILLFQVSQAQDIRLANVGARSLSVGWTSRLPWGGCMHLFASDAWWPEKTQCHQGMWRKTHLVQFKGLTEKTSYQVRDTRIQLPWSQSLTVTTPAISQTAPSFPQPAYGTVINSADKVQPYALVYIYTNIPGAQYPLAVQANEKGNYALDISNLKLEGGNFMLRAVTSPTQLVLLEVDERLSTPFPPLRVSGRKGLAISD